MTYKGKKFEYTDMEKLYCLLLTKGNTVLIALNPYPQFGQDDYVAYVNGIAGYGETVWMALSNAIKKARPK